MAIRHLFLWSVNDKSRAQEVFDQLASLKNVVGGLQNWGIGVNTFTASDNPGFRHFDYALTSDFDSAEDLQTYQEHPVHQEIVGKVFPLYGDWTVVDIEILD